MGVDVFPIGLIYNIFFINYRRILQQLTLEEYNCHYRKLKTTLESALGPTLSAAQDSFYLIVVKKQKLYI